MKTHTFFSKKLVTLVSMIMCLVLAFSAVACGPQQDDGLDENMVQISLMASTDGYGTRALELQAARFNEAFKNKTYTDEATGKVYTGAHLEVNAGRGASTPTSAYLEDTNTIFHSSLQFTTIDAAYHNGFIADIDHILRKTIPGETKSIYDKLSPEMHYEYGVTVEGSENENQFNLVSFPFQRTYNGFSYDIDLFDTGYYIAHPNADTVDNTYTSELIKDNDGEFISFDFVDKNGEKSVGPNGIPGDYDDGLPSSFYEFIVLCEYLKSNGIAPIGWTGMYSWYLALGLGALMFSLLGYENAQSFIDFSSSSLNVVTGFENKNLFDDVMSSDMNVKEPIVTQIEMVESNGYYHTWTLENYMALVFADLIDAMGWANYSAIYNRSHTETQYDFIFGIEPAESDRRCAMLSEGSYWYNESLDALNFANYQATYMKTADERGLSWMPLPVNIYSSVTGEDKTVTHPNGVVESLKGEPQTLDDSTNGAVTVNGNVADDKVKMEAVEDYLLFVCSDAELNKFTVEAGYSKGLEFELDEELMADAPAYIQRSFRLYQDSNSVGYFSDSKTWRMRPDWTFTRGQDSDYVVPRDVLNFKSGPIGFVRNYDGAVGAFKHNMIDYQGWWQYYKGISDVDTVTYAQYPEGHPKEGQNVVFAN